MKGDSMSNLIVVPTYNEAATIGPLVEDLFSRYESGIDIVVVDDNSPDGTAAVVEELGRRFPGRIHLVKRPSKQGVTPAYLAGMHWGLERSYERFCQMDADFSHHPRYIGEIFERCKTYDYVIGSRYVPGGGVGGWGLMRRIISRGGSLYSSLILGCPIRDMTGGFNCWSRKVLETVGIDALISTGFCFQIEMKYKAWRRGFKYYEVPIFFENRRVGVSKMSKSIFFEALLNVWKIRFAKI
jgi:dolichol-phosphate mannosyltransferase